MLSKSQEAIGLDPRVKRTRQLILNAFVELLQKKSLQAITVQDITDRAEVNRATFYAHFKDKYDLLDYAVRETFSEILQNKLPDARAFSRENLRQLIIGSCEYLDKVDSGCHPSEMQIQLLIAKQVHQQLSSVLLQWLEALPQEFTALEVTVSVMSWAIFGAGMEWSKDRLKRFSLEDYADHVCDLLALKLPDAAQAGL